MTDDPPVEAASGADLAAYGAPEVRLLDGERMESALALDGGGDAPSPSLLLTDKRVIYVSGEGRRRRAMFASLKDVQAVEIGFHARSSAAYVWAALALVAAFFLFFVIENPLGRVIGPVAVAGLGAYLIADNLMSPNRQFVIFRAAGSQLVVDLGREGATDAVYAFIGKLFELKEGPPPPPPADPYAWVDRFAPR